MTRGLTELGMTDVASRSRSGFIFKAALWLGLAIVLYVFIVIISTCRTVCSILILRSFTEPIILI
jgi:hypothetical protein